MKLRMFFAVAVMTTPDVPRYTPTEKPVSLSVGVNPTLGADAFGSGLGQGIQKAANNAADIIKAEKDKADRTVALTSRTQLDQAETDLLYHPEKGALVTRGKAAFEVDQSTLKAYDERVTGIEGNLTSPAQKQAFSLMAAQRRVEISRQLQRHIAGELKTYADEANKASLQSTLDNVAVNYQDPDRVEQERKFGLAVIMSDTENKGLPPAVIKAKVDAWESSVHTAVVHRLLVDNPVAAQEYFNKVQGKNPAYDAPAGLVERGNIDLTNRPQVKNADGSISTVRSIGVNVDGKEVLLPTVSDDGRILSTKEAVEQYRKTGKHLGVFESPEASDKYAKALHDQQEFTYLRGGKPSILPAEAAKLEAAIKPLAEAQQGLQTANEIFYSAGEKATAAELIRQVHEKFPKNPAVVKHAESEIAFLVEERDKAKEKEIKDAEDAVYGPVVKVKLAGGVPKRSDVPAEAWARLATVAPEKVDKIANEILHGEEHAVDRVRAAQERQERKEEHDTLMKERAANKATPERVTTWGMLKIDPSTLAKTNLDALYAKGKLTTTHYQDLVTDQLAIKQGKGRTDEILSNKAAVDLVLDTVKITAKKDPERYSKFYEGLESKMGAFERENGRKPKQSEVKDLARGLLAEVSQQRDWLPIDKTVRAFEADPTKVRVPPADRAAITQVLRSRKMPISEEAIRKIYLEKSTRSNGGK